MELIGAKRLTWDGVGLYLGDVKIYLVVAERENRGSLRFNKEAEPSHQGGGS